MIATPHVPRLKKTPLPIAIGGQDAAKKQKATTKEKKLKVRTIDDVKNGGRVVVRVAFSPTSLTVNNFTSDILPTLDPIGSCYLYVCEVHKSTATSHQRTLVSPPPIFPAPLVHRVYCVDLAEYPPTEAPGEGATPLERWAWSVRDSLSRRERCLSESLTDEDKAVMAATITLSAETKASKTQAKNEKKETKDEKNKTKDGKIVKKQKTSKGKGDSEQMNSDE
jgi:hypothetical protein